MKKHKLALTKETIRSLSTASLSEVAGGTLQYSARGNCVIGSNVCHNTASYPATLCGWTSIIISPSAETITG